MMCDVRRKEWRTKVIDTGATVWSFRQAAMILEKKGITVIRAEIS